MIRLRTSIGTAALITYLVAFCGFLNARAMARSGGTGSASAPFCNKPTIKTEEGGPAVDVRLGIEKRAVSPGRELRLRIEDFGTSDLTYGLSYKLARYSRGSWVHVPHGPVFGPRFYLRAGTASECQGVDISRHATVGRYRISKSVKPVGRPKDVVVRATFWVER